MRHRPVFTHRLPHFGTQFSTYLSNLHVFKFNSKLIYLLKKEFFSNKPMLNTYSISMLRTSGGRCCHLIKNRRRSLIRRNRMIHLVVTQTVIAAVEIPLLLTRIVQNEALVLGLVWMHVPRPRVLIHSGILWVNCKENERFKHSPLNEKCRKYQKSETRTMRRRGVTRIDGLRITNCSHFIRQTLSR